MPALDHSAFDAILKAAVKDRFVDYNVVAKERAKLDAYLKALSSAPEPKDANEALAAWINAYNATVLAAYLDHGLPMKAGAPGKAAKVVDVKGFFDAEKHKLFGADLTLNELEEKKVRRLDAKGISADPRVHFAVNCASRDCPPLGAHAYTGAKIAADLEERTKSYLARPNEVAVDDKGKRIVVVQLFEWYASDFAGEPGVRRFIAGYVPAVADKILDETGFDLDYRPYDWTPNAAP